MINKTLTKQEQSEYMQISDMAKGTPIKIKLIEKTKSVNISGAGFKPVCEKILNSKVIVQSRINKLMKGAKKVILIRRGKMVGVLGNEKRFYDNMKKPTLANAVFK